MRCRSISPRRRFIRARRQDICRVDHAVPRFIDHNGHSPNGIATLRSIVGNCTDELAIASLLLFDLEIYCRFLAVIVLNLIFNVLFFIE